MAGKKKIEWKRILAGAGIISSIGFILSNLIYFFIIQWQNGDWGVEVLLLGVLFSIVLFIGTIINSVIISFVKAKMVVGLINSIWLTLVSAVAFTFFGFIIALRYSNCGSHCGDMGIIIVPLFILMLIPYLFMYVIHTVYMARGFK